MVFNSHFYEARFDYIDTGYYPCKSLDPDHRKINNNYLNNNIVLTRDGAGRGGGAEGANAPSLFRLEGQHYPFVPKISHNSHQPTRCLEYTSFSFKIQSFFQVHPVSVSLVISNYQCLY